MHVSEQVRYWTETGASGFLVYRYELRRRAGQGELYSKALVFGGGCAPKNFTAESRKKEVCVPTPRHTKLPGFGMTRPAALALQSPAAEGGIAQSVRSLG